MTQDDGENCVCTHDVALHDHNGSAMIAGLQALEEENKRLRAEVEYLRKTQGGMEFTAELERLRAGNLKLDNENYHLRDKVEDLEAEVEWLRTVEKAARDAVASLPVVLGAGEYSGPTTFDLPELREAVMASKRPND